MQSQSNWYIIIFKAEKASTSSEKAEGERKRRYLNFKYGNKKKVQEEFMATDSVVKVIIQ